MASRPCCPRRCAITASPMTGGSQWILPIIANCATVSSALGLSETRENAAASVQALLERGIHQSVSRLLEWYRARRLGLAGEAFANVRLNRLLAESLPVDEVFSCRRWAMTASSSAARCIFCWTATVPVWLSKRYRLATSTGAAIPMPLSAKVLGHVHCGRSHLWRSGGEDGRTARARGRLVRSHRPHGVRPARARRPQHLGQPGRRRI